MVSELSLDLQINQLECMRYDRQNAYPEQIRFRHISR